MKNTSPDVTVPLASRERTARFPLPEGGVAVLTFPTPLTMDSLEMLAELSALMFRGLKRDAIQWDAQQQAEAEYLSWFSTRSWDAKAV